MSISIGIGTIEEALAVEQGVPEFRQVQTEADYEDRFGKRAHLILIARDDEKPVAFKVGYAVDEKLFYSWLGGVSPGYRRLGLAQQLLEMQETWIQHHGYEQIQVKSMNQFPGMLILLIKNGYQVVGLDSPHDPDNIKIIFQKRL